MNKNTRRLQDPLPPLTAGEVRSWLAKHRLPHRALALALGMKPQNIERHLQIENDQPIKMPLGLAIRWVAFKTGLPGLLTPEDIKQDAVPIIEKEPDPVLPESHPELRPDPVKVEQDVASSEAP